MYYKIQVPLAPKLNQTPVITVINNQLINLQEPVRASPVRPRLLWRFLASGLIALFL